MEACVNFAERVLEEIVEGLTTGPVDPSRYVHSFKGVGYGFLAGETIALRGV